MTHSTPARFASEVAVGSLTVLVLAFPPAALADPAPERGTIDIGAARNRVETPTVDIGRLLNEVEIGRDRRDGWQREGEQWQGQDAARSGPLAPATRPRSGAELGAARPLGALVGVVVAGGAVGLTMRHRRMVRPA